MRGPYKRSIFAPPNDYILVYIAIYKQYKIVRNELVAKFIAIICSNTRFKISFYPMFKIKFAAKRFAVFCGICMSSVGLYAASPVEEGVLDYKMDLEVDGILFNYGFIDTTDIATIVAPKIKEIIVEDIVEDFELVAEDDEFGYEKLSTALVKDRLQNIEGEFDFQYSNQIYNYINVYTNRYRRASERLLGRVSVYFPVFEKALRAKGLPQELKYLSIVESNLNPNARSKSGAVGLWQFMRTTAGIYDLEMNQIVDERRDPYKSTEAALEYLSHLYDTFGDWTVAIAAYNCGPGNVRKAIRKSGSKDFWKMRPFLPKETQNYIPKFIAVSYLMNYYHAHELKAAAISQELRNTETAKVYDKISFAELSKEIGLPIITIRQLNPSFLMNYIPKEDGKHLLTLPNKMMNKVMQKGDMELLTSYVNILADRDGSYTIVKDKPALTITGDNEPVIVDDSITTDLAKPILVVDDEDDIDLDLTDDNLPLPFHTNIVKGPKAFVEPKEIVKPKYEYYRLSSKESIYDLVKNRRDLSLDEILKINHFTSEEPPTPGAIIKVKQL